MNITHYLYSAGFIGDDGDWRVHPILEQRDELKRFAELIVQDCASTIQDMVDHRIPASEYPDRLKKIFDIGE